MANTCKHSCLPCPVEDNRQDLGKVTPKYDRNPAKDSLVITVANIIQGSIYSLEASFMGHRNLMPNDQRSLVNQVCKIRVRSNIADIVNIIQ